MHMESKRIISFLINAEPHNGRGGLASVSFWPLGTHADKIPAPGLHYCNKWRLNTLVSFFSANTHRETSILVLSTGDKETLYIALTNMLVCCTSQPDVKIARGVAQIFSCRQEASVPRHPLFTVYIGSSLKLCLRSKTEVLFLAVAPLIPFSHWHHTQPQTTNMPQWVVAFSQKISTIYLMIFLLRCNLSYANINLQGWTEIPVRAGPEPKGSPLPSGPCIKHSLTGPQKAPSLMKCL